MRAEGEIVLKKNTSPALKSHLRLTAGHMYLKIACTEAYKNLIDARDIEYLGLLMQDQVYFVRQLFIDKLLKKLAASDLSIKYMILLVLVSTCFILRSPMNPTLTSNDR